MNSITKRTAAFTIVAAALAAAVTPSFARSQHVVRPMAEQNAYGAYAQSPTPGQWSPNGNGYRTPAQIYNAPNQCWNDEGYGRWSACDGGQGG
jgi:hypothetical protein